MESGLVCAQADVVVLDTNVRLSYVSLQRSPLAVTAFSATSARHAGDSAEYDSHAG